MRTEGRSMSVEITATEASRNLAEYLNRVVYRGERFIIRRGARAVAELRPVEPVILGKDLASVFASLPQLTPEEAEDFGRDIDEARAELNALAVRDPWES